MYTAHNCILYEFIFILYTRNAHFSVHSFYFYFNFAINVCFPIEYMFWSLLLIHDFIHWKCEIAIVNVQMQTMCYKLETKRKKICWKICAIWWMCRMMIFDCFFFLSTHLWVWFKSICLFVIAYKYRHTNSVCFTNRFTFLLLISNNIHGMAYPSTLYFE